MTVLTEHRLRVGTRDVLLLEGPGGWGEASPIPGYPCDPAKAHRAAVEAAARGYPPRVRERVAVNALVRSADFDADALAGFPAVKVKMRVPTDRDLVARVRDVVGPGIGLRVDANAAWDVDTAIAVGRDLARLEVELFEQPVATLDELAVLRRSCSIPVAADESIRDIEDARRARALDAADVIVLKVQPLGGVRAALDVADASGLPVLPTSMMETSVGVLAGLALACALPDLPLGAGLATSSATAPDVTARPLVAEHGWLTWRTVTPDPALLARYAVVPSSQVVSA